MSRLSRKYIVLCHRLSGVPPRLASGPFLVLLRLTYTSASFLLLTALSKVGGEAP